MTPSPEVDDELVPVSVRLGTVVPPEDPEDWTQPLTWVAAAGMLAGPLVALLWFWLTPPSAPHPAQPASYLLAVILAAGATTSGATQIGPLRTVTTTLAAALFAGLAVIVVGVVTAEERQVGTWSPGVTHAFAAAVAGLGGAAAASPLAGVMARVRSRLPRIVGPGLVAAGVALVLTATLLGTAISVSG